MPDVAVEKILGCYVRSILRLVLCQGVVEPPAHLGRDFVTHVQHSAKVPVVGAARLIVPQGRCKRLPIPARNRVHSGQL